MDRNTRPSTGGLLGRVPRATEEVDQRHSSSAEQAEIIVPPMVYIPVRENENGVKFAEVRPLKDGRKALLAYTALDRLLNACGKLQPWALVSVDSLEIIRDEQPFDTISFDIEIPAELRGREWLR